MSTLTSPPPTGSPPALLTAAEFTARYQDVHAELVKGVVKEYPVPFQQHGRICSRIDRLIGNHVDANDLGHVTTNDSWVQTGSNPDTVRGGDVCYFSYERLPKGEMPEGLFPIAPDLVVEVRSPSNRWNDLVEKAVEYLNVGVRAVVLVDPKSASATVYRADELQQTFHNGDELTIPEVLPGFAVPVSRLFA
ncbi:MAG: Uma2 family endonuclease [Gemmataceae bacterium]